jgi:hypothetical protein
MMRVQMQVGRLLEVRAVLPIKLEEIPSITKSMKDIFERTTDQVVAILDARTYGVEPPEAAEHFVGSLKRDNPRIERSAFLVEPRQALLGLQLERVIREAQNPRRRLFRSVGDAVAYLEPVLTREERARLDAFLEEGRAHEGVG